MDFPAEFATSIAQPILVRLNIGLKMLARTLERQFLGLSHVLSVLFSSVQPGGSSVAEVYNMLYVSLTPLMDIVFLEKAFFLMTHDPTDRS